MPAHTCACTHTRTRIDTHVHLPPCNAGTRVHTPPRSCIHTHVPTHPRTPPHAPTSPPARVPTRCHLQQGPGRGHGATPAPLYLRQGPYYWALHDAAEEDEVQVGRPRGTGEPHQVVQDLLHGWGGRRRDTGAGGEHGGTEGVGGTRQERAATWVKVTHSPGGDRRSPPPILPPSPPGYGTWRGMGGVAWGGLGSRGPPPILQEGQTLGCAPRPPPASSPHLARLGGHGASHPPLEQEPPDTSGWGGDKV